MCQSVETYLKQVSGKELLPDDHNYAHLPLRKLSIFTNTFIFFFQPFSLFLYTYLTFLHIAHPVESRSAHLIHQTVELFTGNSNQDRQHTKKPQKAPDGCKIHCILPLFFFPFETRGFVGVQLHLFKNLFPFLVHSFLSLYHRIIEVGRQLCRSPAQRHKPDQGGADCSESCLAGF